MKKILVSIEDEEVFDEWREMIEAVGYKVYSKRIQELIEADLITLELMRGLIRKEKGE
jgi:hypothetical protein